MSHEELLLRAEWKFRCLRGARRICPGCGHVWDLPFLADREPCGCGLETVLEGGAPGWEFTKANKIVTTGLNKLWDATLVTGLTSPTWYIGLKDAGTIVAGDTMASHAGWATIVPYSNGSDPQLILSAPSGAGTSNAASLANFNIDSDDSVFGGFVKNNSTKGSATGILFSAVDSPSAKVVAVGEVLQVQVSFLASSAT